MDKGWSQNQVYNEATVSVTVSDCEWDMIWYAELVQTGGFNLA